MILKITEVHKVGIKENEVDERIDYAVGTATKMKLEVDKWFKSETLIKVFINVLEVK